MRKRRFSNKTLFAAAALVLAGTAGIGQASAYFTTYVTAAGGYPVTLGYETEIEEKVDSMTKHIMIYTTGESDCYVRVKVFSGSQFGIHFKSDGGWSQSADGYWYYDKTLPVGGTTSELQAEIEVPQDNTDTFNIVVVQECTPVLWDENGEPYADWERMADTTTDIGTADGEELTQ